MKPALPFTLALRRRRLLQWSTAALPGTAGPAAGASALAFPRDFGAHPESRIEWWYATGWLVPEDSAAAAAPSHGFQVTFFRSRTGVDPAHPSRFAARELVFYFREYPKLDPWTYPRIEGGAIADEGRDAWVLSLGGQFHMVNSGWVYHLAPNSFRAGILSPGFHLPLTMPANRDLAFLFYPGQEEYRSLVEAIYPGGSSHRVPLGPEQWIFDVYRVPRATWQATQGALAHIPGEAPVRVPTLSDPAPGAHPDAAVKWTAAMRVPRFDNSVFRLGPGPARLTIDGHEVLSHVPKEYADCVIA